MGLADLVTPVASPHRHDGQLGQDDGSTDGSGHLLAALHPKTNVAVKVANCNKGLSRKTSLVFCPLTAPNNIINRNGGQVPYNFLNAKLKNPAINLEV